MSVKDHIAFGKMRLPIPGKLWLFCIFMIFKTSFALADSFENKGNDTTVMKLIVANIVEKENDDRILITFFESARGYAVLKSNKKFAAILSLLKESKQRGIPLEIMFTESADHSLIIYCVKKSK